VITRQSPNRDRFACPTGKARVTTVLTTQLGTTLDERAQTSATALPAYYRRSRRPIVAPGSFRVLSDRMGPTLASDPSAVPEAGIGVGDKQGGGPDRNKIPASKR
jgi:hypothetical protein